jgi:hypothetical protein
MAQKQIGTGKKKDINYVKVALLIGGGFLLYKLVKKFGSVISDPTGVNQQNEDLQNVVTVDESKLTYPKYQYLSWANSLEQTLLVDSTENETLIDGIIFQIQNDNDWAQLVKDFGVRLDYVMGYIPRASYTLPGALIEFVPERIQDYNNHFSGWGMKARI